MALDLIISYFICDLYSPEGCLHMLLMMRVKDSTEDKEIVPHGL